MNLSPHARPPHLHALGNRAEFQPLDIRHLLIQATEVHPSEANGVHRVADKISAEQSATGHAVSLISLRNPALPPSDRSEGAKPRSVALAARKLFGRGAWLSASSLQGLVAGAGPRTFFHIHSAREPLLLSISMMLRRRSIPYAITVHGRYSHFGSASSDLSRLMSRSYISLVERHVLEGAAFVQAVSADERDIIRRLAPKARVELIENAAYSRRTDLPFKYPTRVRPDGVRPRFGYLGRYAVTHKGLDILVEGFRLYRDRGGTGRLELVGTGAHEEVEALIRAHGLGDEVRAGGGRFGESKLATFASWDYFVQPSRFEGSPIGILEAALAGLPVIVTAGTGLNRAVARFAAGFSVDQSTPQALCDALLRADGVSPDLWQEMSQRSHTMAKSFGDWSSIATRLSCIYADAFARTVA